MSALDISNYHRLVVKVGSSLLVDDSGQLDRNWLENLADDVAIIEMLPAGLGGYALGYLSNPREIGLQLYWRPFN